MYTELTGSSLFSCLFTAQLLTEGTYNSQLICKNLSLLAILSRPNWLIHDKIIICFIERFCTDIPRHKITRICSIRYCLTCVYCSLYIVFTQILSGVYHHCSKKWVSTCTRQVLS